jgi:hypothetical protein
MFKKDILAVLLVLSFAVAFIPLAAGCTSESDDNDEKDLGAYGECRNKAQLDFWQCQGDCQADPGLDECALNECLYGAEGCGIPYYEKAVDCGKFSIGFDPYPDIDKCRLACEESHAECVAANCLDITPCEADYKACRAAC